MLCTSWIGQSDKTENEAAKKKGEWKKIWRFNLKRKYIKTGLHYYLLRAPTRNKGNFTVMQASKSSQRWWIPLPKDNVDRSVHFPPPPGWCYTADGLCQFWFGALQRAYWIKWHWKRTGTTVATTPHTGASRLSCTHTPETHWGVWARYKYIFAWPWPRSEETYSSWWMVIQHSNSRAFQTTQTVYTVYRIPLHGHYWPVLAVRNNGGPQPRMLLKRDEPQRAPAIKSQNKSAYPAACATLKTIECDYCLDIRCRKMPHVVLQTLIKRGNSHFSHSQVFNLLARQIGENGNRASFTRQRLCW